MEQNKKRGRDENKSGRAIKGRGQQSWFGLGIAIGIVALALLALSPQVTDARIITVGHTTEADYWTIQEGVDAAASYGDTIQVFFGTYNENVVITKSLILQSDDKTRTIIDGGGSGVVLNLTADKVLIRGFTIQNANTGIQILSDDNVVMDNLIKDIEGKPAYGIYLSKSTGTTIFSNTVESISGNNTLLYSVCGIYLSSSNGTILDNTILGVRGTGYDDYSANGIYLSSSSGIISGNTISGVSGGSGYYAIPAYGIHLSSSTGATISSNEISSINGPGTDKNIYLESSTRNTVRNNTLSRSDYGVYLTSESIRNQIYNNNIMNSTHNGYDDSGDNGWDNGATNGGNYWSDYAGTDADGDGFGDTPYYIGGGTSAQDNYPFMNKSGWVVPPTVSIYTDKTTYTANETMHLGLDVTNPGAAQEVLFAVWLEDAGGGAYVFIYTPLTLPAGFKYSDPDFVVLTLPSIPAGAYKWHAGLIAPSGSGPIKFIAHDTAEWEFVSKGAATAEIAEVLEQTVVTFDFGVGFGEKRKTEKFIKG